MPALGDAGQRIVVRRLRPFRGGKVGDHRPERSAQRAGKRRDRAAAGGGRVARNLVDEVVGDAVDQLAFLLRHPQHLAGGVKISDVAQAERLDCRRGKVGNRQPGRFPHPPQVVDGGLPQHFPRHQTHDFGARDADAAFSRLLAGGVEDLVQRRGAEVRDVEAELRTAVFGDFPADALQVREAAVFVDWLADQRAGVEPARAVCFGQVAAVHLGVVRRERIEIGAREVAVAARELPVGEMDDVALVVERVGRPAAFPATALAQLVGELVGVGTVARVQVDVPRNQELARPDGGRAAARVELRGAGVGRPPIEPLRKPLILAGADARQVAELGRPRRLFIEPDRDAQLGADALAGRVRNSDAVVHVHAADRHER